MLFNEPKLLKSCRTIRAHRPDACRFSALQRAEIAEIYEQLMNEAGIGLVSVLFNEPKLLKCAFGASSPVPARCFSALQRAEIAEIGRLPRCVAAV